MLQWPDLIAFRVRCERLGIDTPPPVIRGLELVDLAQAKLTAPPATLLDMADEDVLLHLTDLSIREHQGYSEDTRGLFPGVQGFTQQMLREVREASLPYLDDIIESLQSTFEALSAPLVDAAQTWGFSLATTSDQVIDLADEAASAAWRAARDAWTAVGPVVAFRKQMSETFELSPTSAEVREYFGLHYHPDRYPVDYSVCFAAAGNWSWDGAFNIDGKPGNPIDWFALACGGLRLNTPDEVRAKQQQRDQLKHAVSA